jgi:hypothetical protein
MSKQGHPVLYYTSAHPQGFEEIVKAFLYKNLIYFDSSGTE